MKGNFRSFVSGGLVTLVLVGLVGTAAATVGQRTENLDYSNIKVTLDGQQVNLVDANGKAVEPFAISGTTYLPVRAVADALGLNVSWDSETSTVVLSTGETPDPSDSQGVQIGNYAVSILGAKLANDYEGNPAIIITCEWTNNSTETVSALTAFTQQAFQNGVQLESALMLADSGFDPQIMTSLRPGASTTIQYAFTLRDSTSAVEFELTEFLALTDTGTAKKTFDLSALK